LNNVRIPQQARSGRALDPRCGDGISHYLVDDGAGEPLGLDLARCVADNAPLSNYAILNAIPRISRHVGE